MTHRIMPPITGPDQIILTRLRENEIVKPGNVIACDNHFYPASVVEIPASEYDVAIYRITVADGQTNNPTISAENAA